MGFFSKLFDSNKKEFKEVRIDQEVINSVIYYSNEALPNEFLAFFDGEIKDKILYITGLIFLPGERSSTGAVFHSEMMPPSLKYWGTVHSHPGPSARPSDADLATFSKYGLFHMIVCLPYSLENFKAYNRHGEDVSFTVGNYAHLSEDELSEDDFYDEDLIDSGEVLKPGFFDDVDEFNKEFNEPEKPKPKSNIILPNDNIVIHLQVDKNGKIEIMDNKRKK